MDKDTILTIKQGNQEAFARLYNKYAGYALRTAAAITGNRSLAADAVQETFIRVYNSLGSFETAKPFKPWFYKILVNECKRIVTGHAKTVYLSDSWSDQAEAAKKDDYRFEEYESLYRALLNLHEIYRIPVVLKYLNGFSEKEIAGILGININTLKSRLLKGRQKLREVLEKSGQRGISNG